MLIRALAYRCPEFCVLVPYERIQLFRKVFREDLELVYEISHNLVQAEEHPRYGDVWVHRKGATRALPGGHQRRPV